MKNILTILLTTLLLSGFGKLNAQTINWKSKFNHKRSLFNINAGAAYGIIAGAGYGYQVNRGAFPIWLQATISTPAGNKLFDDYKSGIGGQIRILNLTNIQASVVIEGIFRRSENEIVTMSNFGGKISAAAGYYSSGWFIAADLGFDKAAATHLHHKEVYKKSYPNVKDGWFEVPTGGNFNVGLQGGISIGRNDLYLKGGLLRTERLENTLMLPYYGELGYNIRF